MEDAVLGTQQQGLSREELVDWLARDFGIIGSDRRDKATVMADVIYRRYCVEPPENHRHIGRHHRIRAASRVLYLERLALARLREPGTLALVREARARVPRRLWVALVGAWDAKEGK
jgi:hypothetical protein